MEQIGKTLILVGGGILIFGVFVFVLGKIPGIGRLPGDIIVKKENFSFYFPVTTSILLSIFLTFILFVLNKR